MNLPPPFSKASDVKVSPDGTISLIDAQGAVLVQIPISTAFELFPETESRGYERPKRNQSFYGVIAASGSGYGHGIGETRAYGNGLLDGSGNDK